MRTENETRRWLSLRDSPGPSSSDHSKKRAGEGESQICSELVFVLFYMPVICKARASSSLHALSRSLPSSVGPTRSVRNNEVKKTSRLAGKLLQLRFRNLGGSVGRRDTRGSVRRGAGGCRGSRRIITWSAYSNQLDCKMQRQAHLARRGLGRRLELRNRPPLPCYPCFPGPCLHLPSTPYP